MNMFSKNAGISQVVKEHMMAALSKKLNDEIGARGVSKMQFCELVAGRDNSGKIITSAYAYLNARMLPSREVRSKIALKLGWESDALDDDHLMAEAPQTPTALQLPSAAERPHRPKSSPADRQTTLLSAPRPVGPDPLFSLVIGHDGMALVTMHQRLPIKQAMEVMHALARLGIPEGADREENGE